MILRISILLILLLLVPAFYIDRHFHLKKHRAFRFLLWGTSGIFMAFTVWFCLYENFSDTESLVKGQYLMLLLMWSCSTLLFTVVSATGWIFRKCRQAQRIRKLIDSVALIGGLSIAGSMLYGHISGPEKLIVKTYTYQSASIPASFDGFRIVQLSDLHVGTFANRKNIIRQITDSVMSLQPDMIVFTGDLVNYHSGELDAFLPILSKMKAPFGIYAVLGNHDYMNYRHWATENDRKADIQRLISLEKKMGWKVLLNENSVVRHQTDSMAIIGVENDGKPPFPARADLPRAQKGLQADCFSILLSHDPTHWRRAVLPTTNIPLTLSGHTHGMQLQFGHFSPASWFYPEWGGPYTITERGIPRTLYVSLGTGEVLLPFRLGAWPEINVIILHHIPSTQP